MTSNHPFIVVLGIAQDGGYPQAGTKFHEAWNDPSARRHAASLAVIDPVSDQRWMVEATPDFREQIHRLDEHYPVIARPGIDGIILTHAHIGHYTGLIHLGREVMNTREIPTFVMPRMADVLRTNIPWEGLVRVRNIVLRELADGEIACLNPRLSVTPFLVPHRDEYSETIGLRIAGPNRTALFLPDIDRWEELDDMGTHIEDLIASVDIAWLDATFHDRNELPGRDMSRIPHPTIEESMARFATLPAVERNKIRFIHLNHTNPALRSHSDQRRIIAERGFHVAEEMEIFEL